MIRSAYYMIAVADGARFPSSPVSMSSSLRLWVCLRVFAYEYVFESSPMSMSSSMSSSLRLWVCLRVCLRAFAYEYVFEYVFESSPMIMSSSLRLWVCLRVCLRVFAYQYASESSPLSISSSLCLPFQLLKLPGINTWTKKKKKKQPNLNHAEA
jgi:hypothetical protein